MVTAGLTGKINGAMLLARTLRASGAGPIFTLSGHQILPIYDAGIDEQLRFIDTRHENAAVHMADGWARLTGQCGVALVTAAPGFTNALTGVATAWMSESPVLLLSGGVETTNLGRGGFQEMDQLAMIRPIVKGAWMPRTAEEIPALVARAMRVALSGVPGPVHITLPYDVLHQSVDADAVRMPGAEQFGPLLQSALYSQFGQLESLLTLAERPTLIAGPSITRGQTGAGLRELSELTGLGVVVIDSPVGLAEPSLHGLGRALAESDLVILAARGDFAINFLDEQTVRSGTKIVQIAPDAGSIGQSRAVDLGIVADMPTILGHLAEFARLVTQTKEYPRRSAGWRAELDRRRAARQERTRALEVSDAVPVHPMRVTATVRDLLAPGDCVALDGGDFVRWARWTFGGGPWELLTNGKLGALGPGLPLAMAATLARPGAKSVAFVGDGTFGFHAMEFDTAVRHNLPLVAIVGNDAGWATERHRQREVYGPDRLVAADLLPTRYDRVAADLGAHGEHVERPEQLRPALERAFASGKPACINVQIASLRAPSAG
ncbi:MAG: thiamine pyrophosphate-binding protein [Chloroflexi bacterium]|nr:thiamine pyrophosphate-binding protein [Chloroflexota bacterium]